MYDRNTNRHRGEWPYADVYCVQKLSLSTASQRGPVDTGLPAEFYGI